MIDSFDFTDKERYQTTAVIIAKLGMRYYPFKTIIKTKRAGKSNLHLETIA